MAEMNRIAPAHNPPYIAAMRQLREQLPELPLVAAFETDFHRTIPRSNRTFGVPHRWQEEFLVQRWGFHALISFKLIIVAFVCVVAQIVALKNVRTARALLIIGTVMVGLVVVYSMLLFSQHFG